MVILLIKIIYNLYKEKKKKEQFEKRRKAHYDEFHRVKGLKSHDDD